MVGEGGHTGGCEGQLLLFAAFHRAQQEANTLLRGRRLRGIETCAQQVKGIWSILSRPLGEEGQASREMRGAEEDPGRAPANRTVRKRTSSNPSPMAYLLRTTTDNTESAYPCEDQGR